MEPQARSVSVCNFYLLKIFKKNQESNKGVFGSFNIKMPQGEQQKIVISKYNANTIPLLRYWIYFCLLPNLMLNYVIDGSVILAAFPTTFLRVQQHIMDIRHMFTLQAYVLNTRVLSALSNGVLRRFNKHFLPNSCSWDCNKSVSFRVFFLSIYQ